MFNPEGFEKEEIGDIKNAVSDPGVFIKVAGQVPKKNHIPLLLGVDHINEHVHAESHLGSRLLQRGSNINVSDSIVELIQTKTHRTASLWKWK